MVFWREQNFRALWKPEITARSFMAGFAFLPSGLPLSCRRTPGLRQPRQRNLDQVRQPPAPKPPPAVQHRAPGLRPQPQLWGTCLGGQGNTLWLLYHFRPKIFLCWSWLLCADWNTEGTRWKDRHRSLFIPELVVFFKLDLWWPRGFLPLTLWG